MPAPRSRVVLAALYRPLDAFLAILATYCSFPVRCLDTMNLNYPGLSLPQPRGSLSSVPASIIPLRRHPAAVYWIKKRGIQATCAGRMRAAAGSCRHSWGGMVRPSRAGCCRPPAPRLIVAGPSCVYRFFQDDKALPGKNRIQLWSCNTPCRPCSKSDARNHSRPQIRARARRASFI